MEYVHVVTFSHGYAKPKVFRLFFNAQDYAYRMFCKAIDNDEYLLMQRSPAEYDKVKDEMQKRMRENYLTTESSYLLGDWGYEVYIDTYELE